MTDLVPLILCALDDAVRARSLAAPEDADLAALADGLTLAVDHCALASRTPIDAIAPHVADLAEGLTGVLIDGDDTDPSAIDRWPPRVLVARRLADVAASLCVRGMALRRESDALWRAASRLLGMEGTPSINGAGDAVWWWREWACDIAKCDPQIADSAMRTGVDNMIHNLRRDAGMSASERWAAATDRREREMWRGWAASLIKKKIDLTDDEMRVQLQCERDAMRRNIDDWANAYDSALVEAHARELREAKEAHAKEVADLRQRLADFIVPPVHQPAKRTTAELSYRDAILADCAYECTRLLGMEADPAADITVDAMESARAEMKRSHAEVDNLTHDLTAWRTWAKASVLPGSLPKYDTITDNDLRGGVSRHIAKYADEVDALKRKHAENDKRELIAWQTWADDRAGVNHKANATDDDLRDGVDDVITNLRGNVEQITALKRKHAEDESALVEAHARELREAKEAHAKEVADLRESMPHSWRNNYANLERAVCQVLTAAGLEHMLAPGNRRPRLPEGDEWKFALLAVVARATQKAPTRDDGTTALSDWTTAARAAILADCAYECTVYHGPAQGEMRVVVGLRDGKTLDDVAAVLERMGRAPGTYSLRQVKNPPTAHATDFDKETMAVSEYLRRDRST